MTCELRVMLRVRVGGLWWIRLHKKEKKDARRRTWRGVLRAQAMRVLDRESGEKVGGRRGLFVCVKKWGGWT